MIMSLLISIKLNQQYLLILVSFKQLLINNFRYFEIIYSDHFKNKNPNERFKSKRRRLVLFGYFSSDDIWIIRHLYSFMRKRWSPPV